MDYLGVFQWSFKIHPAPLVFPGRSPVTSQTRSPAAWFAGQVPGYVCALHIMLIFYAILFTKYDYMASVEAVTVPRGEFHVWVHFCACEWIQTQASTATRGRCFPCFVLFRFFHAINTYLTNDPQGRASLKKEACKVIPISSFYNRFLPITHNGASCRGPKPSTDWQESLSFSAALLEGSS